MRYRRISSSSEEKLRELGLGPDSYSQRWRTWDQRFEELKQFYATHKRPPHYLKDRSLYIWMRKNRRLRHLLPKERIKKLQSIIGFAFDHRKEVWMKNFKRLKFYYNSGKRLSRNSSLYQWESDQRRDRGNLRPEFAKMLDSIKFSWKKRTTRPWKETCRLLSEYKKKHGTINNIKKNTHPRLYNWLFQKKWGKKCGKISNAQIKCLEKLGVVWCLRELHETDWEKKFNILAEFKNKHGHFCVPSGSEIKKWTSRMMYGYKHKTLSSTHYKKLESIGFEPSYHKNLWNSRILALKKYYYEHGHTNVSEKEDKALQWWIRTRRNEFKKGLLSRKAISELKASGFDFNKN
jgi:hypothetical protein